MSTPSVHELPPNPSEVLLFAWADRGWISPAQVMRILNAH